MKNVIISVACILLAIFLLFSCETTTNEKIDSANVSLSDSNPVSSDSLDSICRKIYTHEPDPPPTRPESHLLLIGSEGIIVEWGEAISLKDSNGCDLTLTDADNKYSYVCFPVRFVKFFDSTIYRSGMYASKAAPSIMSDYYYNNGRPGELKTPLYNILDSETKEELSGYYSDVMIVRSEYAHIIEKGTSSLFFFTDFIVFPCPFYAEKGCCETIHALTPPRYDVHTNNPEERNLGIGAKPFMFPIVDNKIVIEDDMLRKDEFTEKDERFYREYGFDYVNYVDGITTIFSNVNMDLVKLGLDDNLFRDGMTVDELEEYLELVTKEETFAPLFED